MSNFLPVISEAIAFRLGISSPRSRNDLCKKVNVKAVEYLADICLNLDAHLIHISTDFIFDGHNGPYKEDDIPCPLSYYGQSKLDSENQIAKFKIM